MDPEQVEEKKGDSRGPHRLKLFHELVKHRTSPAHAGRMGIAHPNKLQSLLNTLNEISQGFLD
jgi:hypothetical protein